MVKMLTDPPQKESSMQQVVSLLSIILEQPTGAHVRKYKIPIEPVAQERPRIKRRSKWDDGSPMYNPQAQIKRGVKNILMTQHEGEPLECPVFVVAIFYFSPPESWPKSRKLRALGLREPRILHAVKPDKDNCEKFINDCLDGVVIKNDAQIYGGLALKEYREEPGIEIVVYAHGDQ